MRSYKIWRFYINRNQLTETEGGVMQGNKGADRLAGKIMAAISKTHCQTVVSFQLDDGRVRYPILDVLCAVAVEKNWSDFDQGKLDDTLDQVVLKAIREHEIFDAVIIVAAYRDGENEEVFSLRAWAHYRGRYYAFRKACLMDDPAGRILELIHLIFVRLADARGYEFYDRIHQTTIGGGPMPERPDTLPDEKVAEAFILDECAK